MAHMKAFYDTKQLYLEYTGYTKPLSYEEWNDYPSGLKAGLLYLQFYNEITLAWDKANTLDFIEAEEGVSTMLQYLEKNVSIIENNPKRFSPNYIYRVAYNCLYCICHDRKCDKDRLENETSGIVNYDGEELNLFDTIADSHGSVENVLETDSFESQFWSIIEDAGLPAEKVMRYLLSEDEADLRALTKRCKRYQADPLRDVEVALDKVDEIISELRERFLALPADSACGRYIMQFQTAAV